MKNKILYLLILLLSCTIFSCGGDDETTSSGASFSCKIDGTAYSTSGLLAYAVDGTTSFSIYGVKDVAATTSLFMTINSAKKTGTFDISKDQAEAFYTPSVGAESFTSVVNPATGSITISAIDAAHAEGTFSLVLFNTKNAKTTITEGKFNVKFR